MKFSRSITLPIAGLATMAMLSGCGNSANLTGLNPTLDTTPPPAPSALTYASDGSGNLVLSWTESAAPDVAGYQVYVYSALPGGGNGFVPANDPINTDNAYQLPPVADGTTVIYRVRAVDTSGNASAFSASAEFQPSGPVGGDITPIDIP